MPNALYLSDRLDPNSEYTQFKTRLLSPSTPEGQWLMEMAKDIQANEGVVVPLNALADEQLRGADYDLVGAMRSGLRPERNPYDQNRYHWPSTTPEGKWLKAPNHPTAWKQTFMEATGVDPDSIRMTKEKAEEYIRKYYK